ncbi:2-dehydro-3-deoxy-6-phosphogalactonate aldolase [Cupriavidus sp. CV2]|uniref:2-dehydro-3-deoxy-6-phosphogalactonate aldolase n=1 Tax=Cupriavidus ulmosensis TaxID=3065913 RepID=UPI00296B0300|nr:2-dehydro-3-deoxy-6-phosphogalactonate aldolase [Cupriavidus sp. CV2]MDW3688325.1 2-dehydro-3-deoxy-6-phosphogalactonate aldolase [Cupriavidus sp. CV2]
MMQPFLDRFPLVAILRGVTPDEVVPIGQVLVANGFTIIEVPLNSPEPIESIRRLAQALGPDILVGAGTVTQADQVGMIGGAGGRLVVMPHSDAEIVRAAKAAGMACAPGVATPTEGFAALKNGADALKLFPAEAMTPAVLRAWSSVFPKETRFLPVGGITPQAMEPYIAAGATGFGLGSALYKPGFDARTVGERAAAFAAAWTRFKDTGPTAR